jgi:hypothetical protein
VRERGRGGERERHRVSECVCEREIERECVCERESVWVSESQSQSEREIHCACCPSGAKSLFQKKVKVDGSDTKTSTTALFFFLAPHVSVANRWENRCTEERKKESKERKKEKKVSYRMNSSTFLSVIGYLKSTIRILRNV